MSHAKAKRCAQGTAACALGIADTTGWHALSTDGELSISQLIMQLPHQVAPSVVGPEGAVQRGLWSSRVTRMGSYFIFGQLPALTQ
jgi:hypothetical protein